MAEYYEHNGKQLDNTRLELFIALSYLLANCPSEKKTSKAIDLAAYSQENFNYTLDRRRANSIFDSLVKITNDNPDIIPYRVNVLEGKPRYYITKTFFDKNDVRRIYNSIVGDAALSKATSEELADRFLDRVCNPEDKEQVIKKNTRKTVKHRSSKKEKRLNYFKELRDRQSRFYFRTNELIKSISCSSNDVYKALRVVRKDANNYLAAVVYDVIENGKDADIWLYLPDLNGVVVMNMDDVETDPNRKPSDPWADYDFALVNQKYTDIQSMQQSYYKGETGIQYNIKFKFYVGEHNENLAHVEESYVEFFKKRFEYKLGSRTATLQNEDGSTYEKTYENIDAYGEVDCNFFAFRKWYWDYGHFAYLVVLEPSDFNNRLLTQLALRFIKRIQNYGYIPPERKGGDAPEHDNKPDEGDNNN